MPKRSDDAPQIARSAKSKVAKPKAARPAGEDKDRSLAPLDFMLAVLRDPEASLADRKWAAEKAAPYLHPRLQTVEHGGEVVLRHEDALKDLA